ncbi:FluG domain-containing protein [Moelleriella libera RCEF 2490]|uniref:FluG domain-containing protein n=1 Tax=Moelleriella libera RCEF 2490 TaxID=1081109 RepID=A0A167YRT4_9HYPO|nr:FluG domain-containing protein [Moelleriella libera RCEF 2490]
MEERVAEKANSSWLRRRHDISPQSSSIPQAERRYGKVDARCWFEESIGPKAFRRGATNAANGNASDAVRDQLMRHDPRWTTFNSAYFNERVQFPHCRPTIKNDHFNKAHLEERELAKRRGGLMKCYHPKAQRFNFSTWTIFRNDVRKVHDVALQSSDQVKQRRSKKIKNRQMIKDGNKRFIACQG